MEIISVHSVHVFRSVLKRQIQNWESSNKLFSKVVPTSPIYSFNFYLFETYTWYVKSVLCTISFVPDMHFVTLTPSDFCRIEYPLMSVSSQNLRMASLEKPRRQDRSRHESRKFSRRTVISSWTINTKNCQNLSCSFLNLIKNHKKMSLSVIDYRMIENHMATTKLLKFYVNSEWQVSNQ